MPPYSPKTILSSEAARQKILSGVGRLSAAVAATLGPRGRTVVIDDLATGKPIVTKDGVSVSRSIFFADQYENIGAQLVKEVASKAAETAGDGTTTATVLAHAIFREGAKLVAAGSNPTALKRGIDRATAAIIGLPQGDGTFSGGTLAKLSLPVSGDMIQQVGTISANGDASIGFILAEAMEKVGKDGVVTVEESKTMETTLEVVEGMQFDRGFLSPYFVTDAERMEATYSGVEGDSSTYPLILLLNKKLSGIAALNKELMPFLGNYVQPTGRPLVIIAEDVEHDHLTFLIVNKLQGRLATVAVKAPGFGDRKKAILDDLAVLTGATVIGGDLGKTLETATFLDLGSAQSVTVGRDTTTIIGGQGDPAAIEARILEIRNHLDRAEVDYDREKLAERLAKLTGGVAVIKVGAATEAEMKEKKARVEDAMYATRAAVVDGIVPGGGTALFRAVNQQAFVANIAWNDDPDEIAGFRIVSRACEEPLRKIVENAGGEGAIIVGELLRVTTDANWGFDAATSTYRDMIEAGIIDPTKVTRTALQAAASIAGLLLVTEALVVDDFDGIERLRKLTSGAGGHNPQQQF